MVLAKKKDGTTRFCVDYRKLNELTVKDAYPLPRIDESLDHLSAAQWLSTLDLCSGFWQDKLVPDDKRGLYQLSYAFWLVQLVCHIWKAHGNSTLMATMGHLSHLY